MNTEKYKMRVIITACSLALLSLSGPAAAQTTSSGSSAGTRSDAAAQAGRKAETNARQHVSNALAVVRRMETEPGMSNLLQQARGVFIVPNYGRAALGVGGSGGAGVLLAKRDGNWSDPVFYNTGGISVGLQAGAEGGPIALVLNNDKAVNGFMQKNNFTLSADAGLTIVNWSKIAQGTAGTGDIVAWSGTKGLFGSAAIGINDIRYNQNETSAYYRQTVAAADVINGKVSNPQADTLKQALAAASSGTASGSSGTAPSGRSSSGASSGMPGTSSGGAAGTSTEQSERGRSR